MRRLFGLVLILCTGAIQGVADDAPIRHRLIFCEYGAKNRFVELDADGKIAWESKPLDTVVIFQSLPNGNLVYGCGGKPTGVIEINRNGDTAFNYVSKCSQVMGCDRLPNGNTLVGEQGPCQAVEVDPQGNVVRTTKLTTTEEHFHRQLRGIHPLKDGHLLAMHEAEGAVREYDRDGSVVWQYKGVKDVIDAHRLANGNTLIAAGTQNRVIEVTPEGNIVWEFKGDDFPELNCTWLTSLQLLPNGNYLVGNFLRGREGKGAHAFEVTRDKKVVWKFTDHDRFKAITTVHVIDGAQE